MKKLMFILLVLVLAMMFSFPASLAAEVVVSCPTTFEIVGEVPCLSTGEETVAVVFSMQRDNEETDRNWRLMLDESTIWSQDGTGTQCQSRSTEPLDVFGIGEHTVVWQRNGSHDGWKDVKTLTFKVTACTVFEIDGEVPCLSPGEETVAVAFSMQRDNGILNSTWRLRLVGSTIWTIWSENSTGLGYQSRLIEPLDVFGIGEHTVIWQRSRREGAGWEYVGNLKFVVSECFIPGPGPSPTTTVEVEGITEEIEVLEEVAAVRTQPLTVWHVGCNDDGHLELIFVYPYKDNNWLTIYDMAGNEVHREDISYSNPRTKVALPDGMYTVKTFHSEGHIIQEFTVGLPCGVAVQGVAELPKTGFDYIPYGASVLLAGFGTMIFALRKKLFK